MTVYTTFLNGASDGNLISTGYLILLFKKFHYIIIFCEKITITV